MITKAKFKKAVIGTAGVMINIANNLGVTRKAVYDFCKKNPDMMAIRLEETEKILDVAENSLFNQVRKEEQWATKYLLATKGKSRGYVEKTEIEHSGSQNLNLTNKELDDEVKRLLK